jgi:hypothetical protein
VYQLRFFLSRDFLMKFMLGSFLVAGAVFAQITPASATVPVSCAPGLPPVQSAGVQISGGVIELLDDACRPQTGSQLPAPLQVSNVAATPATINAGQSTTYTATIANFISQPVTGVTYDACVLDVFRPGGVLNESIPVTALSSQLSLPVTIPSGGLSGTWSLRLRCTRHVAGQQIVVPAFAAADLEVQSGTTPGGCDNLSPPFVAGAVNTYQSHYHANFGDAHNWVWNNIGNVYTFNAQNGSYDFQGARVRSFSFVAPSSGRAAKVSFPSTVAGVMTSISSQCGNFDVPAKCLGMASSAISWSTESSPPSFKCPLVPGQTYYLNFTWVDPATYSNSGTAVSTCVCPGPNCNATSGNQFESVCAAANNSTGQ